MKLTIFHYHFLTGGVTTAVRQALQAIRTHLPGIGAIRLVGGRCAEGLPAELARLGASFCALPRIDYRDPPEGGPARVAAEAGELASELLERYGGPEVVWWAHNYQLGKNPVFTQALLEALSREPGQRAILEIHDFPECGRFGNLRALRSSLTVDPYPVLPNARYAVLTPRDRAVLLEAGLPEQAVHLLGNPVPAASRPPGGPRMPGPGDPKHRLHAAFGREFPGYDPSRPLAVYPVRSIRRKNVLEACLLTVLSEEPLGLAVTLPGISRAERPYSDLVERVFRSGRCRGLWGIGHRLEHAGLGFEQLIEGSDLVVSSAVQEGYGYLFVNTLQWRKPLLARDLEILEGTRELFAGYPALLYRSLACPLGSGQRKRLRAAYRRKLRSLADMIPRADLRNLEAELESIVAAETVDFSYLPADEQERLLTRLADRGLATDLRQANRELTRGIPSLMSAPVPDRGEEVEERFGLRRFAGALGAILGSFDAPGQPAGREPRGDVTGPAGVQEGVVRRFARLEHLRLLYD